MSEGPTIGDNLSLQAMKEVGMKLLLATFLAMFIFLPSIAAPQISCFAYSGGMISCDGPRGNTLITPLSPSQGILQGDRDGTSYLEPYTLFPPSSSSRRESFSSSSQDDYSYSSPRRESLYRDEPYSSRESYSSRPIEPLRRLDRLDRLDRFDDPLSDPLLPLLLGE